VWGEGKDGKGGGEGWVASVRHARLSELIICRVHTYLSCVNVHVDSRWDAPRAASTRGMAYGVAAVQMASSPPDLVLVVGIGCIVASALVLQALVVPEVPLLILAT
jgi:glycerate kinase